MNSPNYTNNQLHILFSPPPSPLPHCVHTHTHTHTRARTHARTHTHTLMHILTNYSHYIYILCIPLPHYLFPPYIHTYIIRLLLNDTCTIYGLNVWKETIFLFYFILLLLLFLFYFYFFIFFLGGGGGGGGGGRERNRTALCKCSKRFLSHSSSFVRADRA